MKLSAREIRKALDDWIEAWNTHDLDGVMALFHDDILFESWDVRTVRGRRELRRSWTEWFDNHGGFRFVVDEIFVDADSQKALLGWTLEWPSREKPFEGEWEKRRGVDVLHFEDGKIMRKLTYSKTTIDVGGRSVGLTPGD